MTAFPRKACNVLYCYIIWAWDFRQSTKFVLLRERHTDFTFEDLSCVKWTESHAFIWNGKELFLHQLDFNSLLRLIVLHLESGSLLCLPFKHPNWHMQLLFVFSNQSQWLLVEWLIQNSSKITPLLWFSLLQSKRDQQFYRFRLMRILSSAVITMRRKGTELKYGVILIVL